MKRGRLASFVLLAVLAAPPALGQNPDKQALDDAGFVEMLRREDPALAERFVTLRDAQTAAAADLQQAMKRYGAGGPELRAVFLPQLQQARRRYGEAALALLDFLDARDRAVIARMEGDIARFRRVIEERARERPELERFRRGE